MKKNLAPLRGKILNEIGTYLHQFEAEATSPLPGLNFLTQIEKLFDKIFTQVKLFSNGNTSRFAIPTCGISDNFSLISSVVS